MTDAQLDRLAAMIADALIAGGVAADGPAHTGGSWLPIPVRPEPPGRNVEPPVWTAAAQTLGDVAPGVARLPTQGRTRRRDIGETTNLVRAAAAGRGAAPIVAPTGRTTHGGVRGGRTLGIDVPIGVSNRHIHLSTEHARALIGRDQPTQLRAISQPGQFAANETLSVVGPGGSIDNVRIVGPARGQTQVEIALSDARRLGIDAPVAASGSLAGSAGSVTLRGPAGSIALAGGVIVAARHLHLSAADAARWGIADGARLDVRCGTGARAITFHDVLVRARANYATELHLDADEAFAAGVKSGDGARILAMRGGEPARRPLLTERDVLAVAASGTPLPARAILTPSARDRARALGLLA